MPVFSRFLIFCALAAAIHATPAAAEDAKPPPMVMEYNVFIGADKNIPAYAPVLRWEVDDPKRQEKLIEYVKEQPKTEITGPSDYINKHGAFNISYRYPASGIDGVIKVFGNIIVLVELKKTRTAYTDMNGLEAFLAAEEKKHDTTAVNPFTSLKGDEIIAVQHNILVDKRLPFWVVRDRDVAETYLSYLKDLPKTTAPPEDKDPKGAYTITLANPPEGMQSVYTVQDGVIFTDTSKRFLLSVDDGGKMFADLAKIVAETPAPDGEKLKELWGLSAKDGGATETDAPDTGAQKEKTAE